MLSPSQAMGPIYYVAVLVTGALIGAITAVLFAKKFHGRDPGDVFLAALGIPAVLITTVSNISTKSEALHEVNQAKVVASNAVLNPSPAPEPASLEVVEPPAKPKPEGTRLINRAWAEERSAGVKTELVQAGGAYFVVIGKYSTEVDARRALERWRGERFRTELYFPKNLRVLRAGKDGYYVSYSGPLPQDDAMKVFKVVQINDPQLSPQLLRQK
jgi:hypothetical protein